MIIILFAKFVIRTVKPVIRLPATASAVIWKLALSFFCREVYAFRTAQSVSTKKHRITLAMPALTAAKPAQDQRWMSVRAAKTGTALTSTNTPTRPNATNLVLTVSSLLRTWTISVSTVVQLASLALDWPSTVHRTEVVGMGSFSTTIHTNV